MTNRTLIFLITTFLLSWHPAYCLAASWGTSIFAASSGSTAIKTLGSQGGWTTVSLGKTAVEESSGTSAVSSAVGTPSVDTSSWEKWGWQLNGNTYQRISGTTTTGTYQTNDWWESSIIASYSSPFSEQGDSAKSLVKQWSVNSVPVVSSVTATGTSETGEVDTTTTTKITEWDTTTYGEYETIAESWTGTIDTEIWKHKHFGESETVSTSSFETLTPYGNSVVNTGAEEKPGTVATSTGTGKKIISIPQDVDDPEDADNETSSVNDPGQLSEEIRQDVDFDEYMERILPEGSRGMTVGPDGNPIPLDELSAAQAETERNFDQIMEEAATAQWPPAVQLGIGTRDPVGTSGYNLTQEEQNTVTDSSPELLGEETEKKTGKTYDEDTPVKNVETTIEILGIEHHASVTVTETTLIDQWTETEETGRQTSMKTTGGETTPKTKQWTVEADPVVNTSSTVETNPDDPNEKTSITTTTTTTKTTVYEQDIDLTSEKIEKKIETVSYNVKEYAKYRITETTTIDGVEESSGLRFETVELGETTQKKENTISEKTTPAREETAGDPVIVSSDTARYITVVEEKTVCLERWTEDTLTGSHIEETVTGGEITHDVKKWTEKSAPWEGEAVVTTETDPDNPDRERTVTTTPVFQTVTEQEQRVEKTAERTEVKTEISTYTVKEYGKYQTTTTTTVDGEGQTPVSSMETILLGETDKSEETIIAGKTTPAQEKTTGDPEIVSAKNVQIDAKIEYGEWTTADAPEPPHKNEDKKESGSGKQKSSDSASGGKINLYARVNDGTEDGGYYGYHISTGLKNVDEVILEAAKWSLPGLPEGQRYEYFYSMAGENKQINITVDVLQTQESFRIDAIGETDDQVEYDLEQITSEQEDALDNFGYIDRYTGKIFSIDGEQIGDPLPLL